MRHALLLLIAASAGLLPAMPAVAAPPLPARNLVVEVRVVEQSTVQRQGLGAAGGVVLGTTGSTATGGLTVRAGSESVGAESAQRVLVMNGGRAAVRLAEALPLRSVEWAWTGSGSGVSERTVWIDVERGVEVRPSWPGGAEPVRVEITVRGAAPAQQPSAEAARLQASTELLVAPGMWTEVARVREGRRRDAVEGGRDGLVVGTASASSERVVELRVLAP